MLDILQSRRWHSTPRTLHLLAASALAAGCASSSDSAVTRRYAGWLEVTERSEAGSTQIERVRGVGLRIGNGVLLGGFDERLVSLPPDCRLVLIVKTEEQLQQWARRLAGASSPGEKSACVKLLDF